MRFTYFAAVASLLAAAPHAAAFVSQWYPPDEVTVGKPVREGHPSATTLQHEHR